MPNLTTSRYPEKPHWLIQRDSTGKIPSGSRYFYDPKQSNIKVVIEIEYLNSFLVRFMSEEKSLQREPQRFTREELEEKLTEAQGGIVKIVIQNATGHIKAVCLKNFLKGCPRYL